MYFFHWSPPGTAGHGSRGRPDRRWLGPLGLVVLVGCLVGCSSGSPGPSEPATTSATAAPATGPTSSAPATTTEPPTSPVVSSVGSTLSSVPAAGSVAPFRTAVPGIAVGTRVGLVAASGSDPFSKAVTESITAQLALAGAELISCDPGADDTLTLDCARRLATQQVDAWIVVQPGTLGGPLCDAGPPDVPLIVVAGTVSCQTAQVGADDRRAGFLTGAQLGRSAELLPSCADDALIIVANSANTSSEQRTDGIRAGIASRCPEMLADAVVIDAAPADRVYGAFTNALNGVPDETEVMVAAVDDGAALAAVAALPTGRADHITVAAIGADQRARCEIVGNRRWIGDAALFPDRYGEVAVPALLDALHGQEIHRNMYVETAFLTADSLGQFYDLSDCPGQ